MAEKQPLTDEQRAQLRDVLADLDDARHRLERSLSQLAQYPEGRPFVELMRVRIAAGQELPTEDARRASLLQLYRDAVQAWNELTGNVGVRQ